LIGVLIGNPTQSLAGTALLFSGVPFYYFFRKRKRSEM
jgi:LPXTG-motif cell wall-anchored protein